MLFHTPIFAAFLIAAAIPLILYLIFKSRKRDSSLGSIYILRKLVQSQKKLSEWKRYVIILMRTLALIALPLAFMQPYFPWQMRQAEEFPSSPASSHRIILFDLSQSMSASFGTRSKYNSAVSLCRQILASASFPGRVDLLSMDGHSLPVTLNALPITPDAIDQAVTALYLAHSPADFETSLRQAADLFRQSPEKNKELYILSDFSDKNLRTLSAMALPSRLLHASGVRVFPVTFERPDSDNFAISSLTPGTDLVLASQPTIFSITVGYYGSKPSAETLLTIQNSSGDTIFDQVIALAPGEKTIEIPLSLTAGEETLTARLKADDYPADDVIARSFRVRSELNVIVVQGINTVRGFDNPREWLRLALHEGIALAKGSINDEKRNALMTAVPEAQRAAMQQRITAQEEAAFDRKSGDIARTVVVNANPSQLSTGLLRDIDAMILLDTETVSPEAVVAIIDYATRGGTVILAPGPTARPDAFNAAFARILPVDLANPFRDQIDPETYQQAVVEKTTDRVLHELEDARGGNIGSARFYNWYTTVPNTERLGTSLLLSLSDGAPLLMEKSVGRGRVLLWTAGFGSEWHSLVVHAAYPLLLTRLLTVAAASVQFPLNLRPGEPIIRPVSAATVRLVAPNGTSHIRDSVWSDQRGYIRFDQTQQPGDYAMHLDPQDDKSITWYHVSADQEESDHRAIADPARKQLQELLHADLLESEPQLIRAVGQGYEGGSAATWFAVTVLATLVCEAWLCRRFFT